MSLDEKLKKLKIDSLLKSKLALMPYEAKYLEESEFDESKNELKKLNLNDLVGMCRPDADRVNNCISQLKSEPFRNLILSHLNLNKNSSILQFLSF